MSFVRAKRQIVNFRLTSSTSVPGRSSALRIVPVLQVSSDTPSHGRRWGWWRPSLTRCTRGAGGPSQTKTTKWHRQPTLAYRHPQLQEGKSRIWAVTGSAPSAAFNVGEGGLLTLTWKTPEDFKACGPYLRFRSLIDKSPKLCHLWPYTWTDCVAVFAGGMSITSPLFRQAVPQMLTSRRVAKATRTFPR